MILHPSLARGRQRTWIYFWDCEVNRPAEVEAIDFGAAKFTRGSCGRWHTI